MQLLKRMFGSDLEPGVPVALDGSFEEARRLAAADERSVILIRPDLSLLRLACPVAGSIPPGAVEQITAIVAPEPKRNIAVITATGFAPGGATAAVGSLEWNLVGKTIPFFGLLNGLAYIGHAVWVFDGRPSEIEAGCREADVLIIDSEVAGRVTPECLTAARKAMRGASIFVHDRASFALRPVGPEAEAQPDSWASVITEARNRATHGPQQQIVLVQPDKSLVCLPCIPAEAIPGEQLAQVRRIIPEGMARNIAVIAPTELVPDPATGGSAAGLLRAAARTIPFFGLLLNLASAGNPLWIFDGRPEAVEAGCRGADLLFIDNVLGDKLPARTVDQAAKVMRSDNIVIYDRVSRKIGFIRQVGASPERLAFRN